MADVGIAKVWNVVPMTPVTNDFLWLCAERPVIFRNIAHPAEPQASDAAKMRRGMKQQTVDGIKMLADFLYHHDMPREAWQQWRSAEHGECHQVEGDRGALIQRRLKTAAITGEPAQRPMACHNALQAGSHHRSSNTPIDTGKGV